MLAWFSWVGAAVGVVAPIGGCLWELFVCVLWAVGFIGVSVGFWVVVWF